MKHKGEQALSCSSCGLGASPGSKFCSECGNELLPTPSFCSECGSPLANTAKFCGSCGVAVGGAPEQANLEPENAGREIAEWLTPIIGEVVDESLESVQIFAGPTPAPACTVSFSLGVVDLRLDTTQVDLALLIDPDTWEDVTEVDDQEPETHRHFYLEPDDFDELGFELIEDLAAQLDSESWKVVRTTEDGMTEEEMFEVSAVEDVLNSPKDGPMTTPFDNKADILVQFGWAYFDEPNFANLVEENSGVIDLASKHLSESMTLTNGQRKTIEDFFAYLVAMTGHEDIGFTQLEDFFLPIYEGFTDNYEGWERSPLLDKTRKMPATTLHNKARILADFALGYFDEPELSDFISRHAETFATCQGYVRGEIETIEGKTRDQIESLFTKFLAEVEAEEGEYEDIEDVFVAHYDGDELIGLYKPRG